MAVGIQFRDGDSGAAGMTRLETLIKIRGGIMEGCKDENLKLTLCKNLSKEIDGILGA